MSHEEIEEIVEGKTIETFSSNLYGTIIRFNDGSKLVIMPDGLDYSEHGAN